MTDETGPLVQVNIDLVRHGAELAAFLRAHGLVGGGSGAQLPAEGSGTVCDELSGTVGGERLTCRYVPSADRRLIPVVYRSQVRPLLRAAVNKALLSLHGRKGTSAPAAEEYAATLLTGQRSATCTGHVCGISPHRRATNATDGTCSVCASDCAARPTPFGSSATPSTTEPSSSATSERRQRRKRNKRLQNIHFTSQSEACLPTRDSAGFLVKRNVQYRWIPRNACYA